jgi:two-component system, response regulator
MINKFVLLVEDNPDDVTLTEMAFARAKVPVNLKVACDGKEALDLLFTDNKPGNEDTPVLPELILLDLKLPLVSGLDVLKEVRAHQRTSQVPVVVLTSSSETRDQTESYRLGANEYFLKPTGFTQFIDIIQNIKAKWLNVD